MTGKTPLSNPANCADLTIEITDTTVDDAEEGLGQISREPSKDCPTPGLQPEGGDDLVGLPVDRGWAWVILAGTVFESFIYGGMMKSFGIFFVEFQKRFKSTSSATSLVSSIQNIVLSVGALVILTLVLKKISGRTSVFVGAIINSSGFIITAFAEDIRVLYFSFGILGGTGIAMIFYPALTIVNQYFKKHRGLANSVMMSGSSLGALISAPVITHLFQEYGFTGANILVAAIFLHVLITGALLRPPEFYTSRAPRRQVQRDENWSDVEMELLVDPTQAVSEEETDVTEAGPNSNNEKLHTSPGVYMEVETNDKAGNGTLHTSPGVDKRRYLLRSYSVPPSVQCSVEGARRPITSQTSLPSNSHLSGMKEELSMSKVALYASSELIYGSMFDIPDPQNNANVISPDRKWTQGSCGLTMFEGMKAVLTNRNSILRNPVFLIYLAMSFVILPGAGLVPVYIAPYATDLGIPTKRIALLYTVTYALDLASRVACGFIADRKWLSHTTLIALGAIVIGTAAHVIRFFTTFPLLMAFAVVMGLSCGTYTALFGAVLADLMGLKQFKNALGVTGLVQGASLAVVLAIAGLLRDDSGSYLLSYHLLGVLAYIGAGLSLTLPCVKRWRDKHTPDET